jgi:hypothetical protein
MIISPIIADCIRCFDSEGAVSNNLHDNVLCPEDYQGSSSDKLLWVETIDSGAFAFRLNGQATEMLTSRLTKTFRRYRMVRVVTCPRLCLRSLIALRRRRIKHAARLEQDRLNIRPGHGSAATPSSASGGCVIAPVADSLEEAGDRLFTFTRLPPTQWRSARTTNAIASSAQNNIAAVSADGSTVWVLIRRLNSSCRRSMMWPNRCRCRERSRCLRGRPIHLRWRRCPAMAELESPPVAITNEGFPKIISGRNGGVARTRLECRQWLRSAAAPDPEARLCLRGDDCGAKVTT